MRRQMQNRISRAFLLSFSLLAGTSACVTVNVNFPESAVQKATDEYVRELYKTRDRKGQPDPASSPSPTPSSKPMSELRLPSLITEALADEMIKTSSPVIDAIRGRQASRLDKINAEKRQGNLGEDSRGLLVFRTDKKLLRAKLDKLVSEENKDREALFAEMMSLNPIPEEQIRKNFSRSFQDKMSPSGTWVQGVDGEWSKKP